MTLVLVTSGTTYANTGRKEWIRLTCEGVEKVSQARQQKKLLAADAPADTSCVDECSEEEGTELDTSDYRPQGQSSSLHHCQGRTQVTAITYICVGDFQGSKFKV